MLEPLLEITQIASHDLAGGAAVIPWLLFKRMKERGYQSSFYLSQEQRMNV